MPKIKCKLKEYTPDSMGLRKDNGEINRVNLSRGEAVGLEEVDIKKGLKKIGSFFKKGLQKAGIKFPEKEQDPDEFSGISKYLSILNQRPDQVKNSILDIIYDEAKKKFPDNENSQKEYVNNLERTLNSAFKRNAIDQKTLSSFPLEAQKILISYFKNQLANKQKETPATQAPSAQSAQKPAQQNVATSPEALKSGIASISLPHANLLKSTLSKTIGKAIFNNISADQNVKKQIFDKVMAFVNSLPQQSNKIISEQETNQSVVISDPIMRAASQTFNLNKIQADILAGIKAAVNVNNIKDLLLASIPADQKNSKQALQYKASLEKNPQKHLQAFLNNVNIALKAVVPEIEKAGGIATKSPSPKNVEVDKSIAGVTKSQGTKGALRAQLAAQRAARALPAQKPLPPERSDQDPRSANQLNESQIKRFQKLAGIKNEN